MKSSAPREGIPPAWRRPIVLALAVVLFCAGVLIRLSTDEASGHGKFGSGSLIRLGVVFAALWLAWPSLLRPATWLPPGMAIVILGGIGVLAVQPRLLPAVLPAVGMLLSVSAAVRFFRG